jgi:hypothetical protein
MLVVGVVVCEIVSKTAPMTALAEAVIDSVTVMLETPAKLMVCGQLLVAGATALVQLIVLAVAVVAFVKLTVAVEAVWLNTHPLARVAKWGAAGLRTPPPER